MINCQSHSGLIDKFITSDSESTTEPEIEDMSLRLRDNRAMRLTVPQLPSEIVSATEIPEIMKRQLDSDDRDDEINKKYNYRFRRQGRRNK